MDCSVQDKIKANTEEMVENIGGVDLDAAAMLEVARQIALAVEEMRRMSRRQEEQWEWAVKMFDRLMPTLRSGGDES